MTAPVEVYVSAAREDTQSASELAGALSASAISCFAGGPDRSAGETLAALETCRAVVFLMSARANASSDVGRELERAAGRGVPIITYAIEDALPSASIAYFTETIPAIPAWTSGDRQQSIRTLIDAVREALTESPVISNQPVLRRSAYSRTTYRDTRRLQIAVALALAITACLSAYAVYHDIGFLIARMLGRQAANGTAADHFALTGFIPAFGGWCVIASAILVLRRARLNLLSFFADVRVSAGEILWRPFVPFANAFWLPRMANALRSATDVEGSDLHNWPLARSWGIAFLCTYSLGGVRDVLLNTTPQSVIAIVAVSVPLDLLQIVTAGLTYAVLSQVLDSVRAQRSVHQAPQVPSPTPGNTGAVADASADEADVLVVFAPEDAAIAANVAKVLEEFTCRCWTSTVAPAGSNMAAHHLSTFDVVLVIVSRASHSSQPVAELVGTALAGPAAILPFVVDAPPPGSTLGHYIRSLHWIDGTAGAAALRSDRVRAAFDGRRVDSRRSGATAVLADRELFSRFQGAAAAYGRYRPATGLRTTAKLFAIVQIVIATVLGVIAFAIALTPQNAEPLTAFGISMVLVAASLPAWAAFLLWLWVTDHNARLLKLPSLASRFWLLCQVGVPGVSLTLAGRALSRLQRALSYGEDIERRDNPIRGLRLTWAATGVVWTVAFLAAWELGARGWLVTAMLISVVQCVATGVRGVQRVRVMRDIGSRLEARVRPWFTAERTV